MSARLPAEVMVGALLRATSERGGFGAVLARGDPHGGAILLVVSDRGGAERLVERGVGGDGRAALIDATPAEDSDGYWRRRRSRDPDLWVVALDVAAAERFAAETIMTG